jgi:alcohol dehydrogenase (cytochrome c)
MGLIRVRVTRRVATRIALIALTVAIAVTLAATFPWKSLTRTDFKPSGVTWKAISWRAQLFARKATGGVPDLSWAELWQMTRIRGGYGLVDFVTGGQSLNGSVVNPYTTDDDLQGGARIFTERCSVCHGSDGSGWHGEPPLNRPGLQHGDSDLAIYKVIRDGIPGTAMVAPDLKPVERWQVVGHVRTLQTQRSEGTVDVATHLDIQVSSDRLRAAGTRSDEWLTYSGSLDGQRYATAKEITPANVSQLRVQWIKQFDTDDSKLEATPLVADGVIFITEPPSNVVALDAKSGHVIWTYSRNIPADLPLCCGRVNRGLAILGHVLFLGSLDGYLVAIDANTGKVIWQTKVADPSDGYTLTGAPLIANLSVIVGVAGGEYGIRGYLAAYDAATGRENWKFFTIPGPGELGHDTWENDAWRTGGGPTWVTGSYDPSLNLLYWGVGNPAPDFSGVNRPGDNLFTNSVIALHANSGKLAWYFQFTPHDEHDWDSTQTPILADVSIGGKSRKVICWANRNGFYYVLDRVTGEFLAGTAFVEQDWAKGLDAKGRPVPREESGVSKTGRLTRPSVAGGTNWQNPAFDESRGLVFVPATEGASVFTKSPSPKRGDRGVYMASGGSMPQPPIHVVRALDVTSGAKRWERFAPPSNAFNLGYSGLLATGAGLVFGASGGDFFAIDSATGRELWRVALGGATFAAPISFTVNGRQVIAVSAGRALFVFGL